MKYVESKGYNSYDYKATLSQPIVSATEWAYMERLSNSWVTCPTGNLHVSIPRSAEKTIMLKGKPEDERLVELDLLFLKYVEERNKQKCLELLKQIEERGAELLTSN